ncbi:hypothetical protein LZ30DRAFT_784870 [Colletotrichum cereale]|nr:hypothetical protein LZ30DRAFT_784870 [Colletotrichum cereale]
MFAFFAWPVLYGLQLLGFGPLGPIAGGFAAWWQAAFYGAAVPAGGVFAYFQHVAMTWFI